MRARLPLFIAWLLLILLVSPCITVAFAALPAFLQNSGLINASHFIHTLLVTTIAVAFAGLIGVPLGLAFASLPAGGYRLATAILATGLLLPLEFHAMVWLAWLGTGTPAGLARAGGGIEQVVERLLGNVSWVGSLTEPRLVASIITAAWVHGIWGAGILAVGVAAASRRVPQDLLDSTSLETNKLWYVLRNAVLPFLGPPLAALLLVNAMYAWTEISVVDLLQLRTLADDVYVSFQLEADSERALAASLPLVALAMAQSAALLYLVQRGVSELASTPARAALHRRAGPLTRYLSGAFVLGGLVMISIAPYTGIVIRASGNPRSGAPHTPVSWLAPVMETASVLRGELLVSLAAAAGGAALATFVGFLLTWVAPTRRMFLPLFAIAAGLAGLPGPVIGIGVNRCAMALGSWFYDSYAPLVWGLAIRVAPVALAVACAGRLRASQEIFDAAALDGGAFLPRLFWFYIPLSRTYMATSFLLGLLLGLGDVGVSVITAPPGTPPVSVRVFSLLHYGLDDHVAGVAFWLMATVIVLTLVLLALAKQRGDEPGGAARKAGL